MRYTVDWTADAENALAGVWLDSGFDPDVTAAQARIDQLLAADPHGNGEHRSEGLYRIEVSPPVATYSIDDAARHVEVSSVWYRP